MNNQSRAWAEINLDAIAHNVQEIRRITNPHAEVMGVVKADAYGHGVREVANTLLKNGITRLAVSMVDEAIELRQDGIKAPLLVLGYTDPCRADDIINYDITQTVFSHELARTLSDRAVQRNTKIKVHVKIDTGMGRVGFLPGYSAVKDVMEINKLPGLVIEGMFTHFAVADEDGEQDAYTLRQFELFNNIATELSRVGIHIPVKHVANSAAIIRFPQMHLDMVRAGIILYGLHPSGVTDTGKIDLRPAMSFKARVTNLKTLEAGASVSYGRTYQTNRPSQIATVSIGYADGYLRAFSNKADMLINGVRCPVRGRVCMDQCMAEVTHMENQISIGDTAELFGENISVNELAEIADTISYELICLIGRRVPRVYYKDGRICNVLNFIVKEQ